MRWDDTGTIGGSGNAIHQVQSPDTVKPDRTPDETQKIEFEDQTEEFITKTGAYKPIIIIINGKGGCGKDTIISRLSPEWYPITISTVDMVKKAAVVLGYNMNDKTNEGRKFLHDIKMASQTYNNFPNRYVVSAAYRLAMAFSEIVSVENVRIKGRTSIANAVFRQKLLQYMVPDIDASPSNHTTDPNAFFRPVIFIHCREPESITDLLSLLGYASALQTLAYSPRTLIVHRSETDGKVYGNHCDDDVDQFEYDYTIVNDDINAAVQSLESILNSIRGKEE